MKVLIADKFPSSAIEQLEASGCIVHYNPDLNETTLPSTIRDTKANVLIVRSTKVNADAISTGFLSLIVRSGAGYNTIDVATASAHGVYVSNCPGKNSIAVAELAFGLMLSIDRRLSDNATSFRNGNWNKKEFSKAKGLFGQRLGLLGLGQIGHEMVKRAKAFGMPVIAWSRSLTLEHANELGIEFKPTPLDVAANCDILSIHVGLKPETRNLVNESLLNILPKGAIFINTARAEIVDEQALIKAVKERNLRVGLDVFSEEPSSSTGTFSSALCSLNEVYVTHHIGASTDQAQDATSAETVRIILSYKDTGIVPNVVNLSKYSPAKYLLTVRHYDRVGVLAHIFNVLKQAGINVEETSNIVFEGAQAAIARIHLDLHPNNQTLEQIKITNSDIIELSLLPITAN